MANRRPIQRNIDVSLHNGGMTGHADPVAIIRIQFVCCAATADQQVHSGVLDIDRDTLFEICHALLRSKGASHHNAVVEINATQLERGVLHIDGDISLNVHFGVGGRAVTGHIAAAGDGSQGRIRHIDRHIALNACICIGLRAIRVRLGFPQATAIDQTAPHDFALGAIDILQRDVSVAFEDRSAKIRVNSASAKHIEALKPLIVFMFSGRNILENKIHIALDIGLVATELITTGDGTKHQAAAIDFKILGSRQRLIGDCVAESAFRIRQ